MAELFSDAEIEAATGGHEPPTADEIRRRADEIQAEWCPRERLKRAGVPPRKSVREPRVYTVGEIG